MFTIAIFYANPKASFRFFYNKRQRVLIMENRFKIPGYRLLEQEKVRNLYDVPGGRHIAVVATDMVSINGKVLEDEIPGKGICLTKISAFWKEYFSEKKIIDCDLVDNDANTIFTCYYGLDKVPPHLKNRTLLIIKTQRKIPFKFIVRGYMDGSLEKIYDKNEREAGMYFDNYLPAGLKYGEKLSEPIFTPMIKSKYGYNESDFGDLKIHIGYREASEIKKSSLLMYYMAHDYLNRRGLILAATNFEFGYGYMVTSLDNSFEPMLTLIGEVLTPDSSRFYTINPDGSFKDMSKQYLRTWLKENNTREIPKTIQRETMKRYRRVQEITLS